MQTTLNHVDRKILLYFPVLHTEADLGQLSGPVRRLAMQRMGMVGVVRKTNLIEMIWTRIERFCKASPLPFEKIYLYQDGLPLCGKETAIVTDLARSGSRNHKLLVDLMTQGATLVGTESAELLVKEYTFAQKMLASLNTPASSDSATASGLQSGDLLEQRDRFIARRINQTLKTGATGILFIGMLHNIIPELERDIEIIHPLNESSLTSKAGDHGNRQANYDRRR